MRIFLLGSCLCYGLLLSSAQGAEAETPSIELLLYLADWETDARGRLVDPMDLPDGDPKAAKSPPADTRSTTSSTPEYPR